MTMAVHNFILDLNPLFFEVKYRG